MLLCTFFNIDGLTSMVVNKCKAASHTVGKTIGSDSSRLPKTANETLPVSSNRSLGHFWQIAITTENQALRIWN